MPTEVAADTSKADRSPDRAAGTSKAGISGDDIMAILAMPTGKETCPAGSVVA